MMRKSIDILPPEWNEIFKHRYKSSKDDLTNTSLADAVSNEKDRTVTFKVRFDHDEIIIRLSNDPLLS